MKNRVLRLAIVAILVVAMVLTVAACGEKKPAPTQAPTPTKAPTQAPTQAPTKAPTQAPTKAPTVAPTQAPTEAPVDPYDAFVEKYGLTFTTEIKRDKDDKKANDYDGKLYEFIVDYTKATALYNAILKDAAQNAAEFEISGKVADAKNFEGKKIDSDSYFFIDSNNEPPAGTAAPTADGFYATNAGTYTVNWTIKVSESGDAEYGIYNVPKASETITFTKIYVIEKAAVEVKPFESDLYLPIANQPDYDIEEIYVNGIVGLPEVVDEWIDEEDYSIYALSTITDLTVAGEFIVPIIVKNDKGVEVDPTTLVFANYNLTFKDGKLIVYTDEQDLAAKAAFERVKFAKDNPAAYALAVAEYEALDAVEKGLYASKYDPAPNPSPWAKNEIAKIKAEIQKSAMDPKVEEAKALADAWFNSLKAADKLEAFNEFVLGLVVNKWDDTKNEQKYVYNALVAANTAAEGKYAGLLGTANFKVIEDRDAAKEEAEDTADAAIAAVATVLGAIADADDLTEAKLAVIEKAIAYADTLVANASDEGKEALAVAKAAYAELVARYNAIFSIVDGFDAYIKGNYVSADVEKEIGYDFDEKAIKGGTYLVGSAEVATAAKVIYGAPAYYIDAIAAAYRAVVEDYDKFNAALVSAVADVRTLVAADMATYSKKVTSFDGVKFVAGNAKTRLAAMQDWLVAAAKVAFVEEYESVAKKGIDEVIARSLKDAVKTVADFVEDFEGQADTATTDVLFADENVVINSDTNLVDTESVLEGTTKITLGNNVVLSATNRTGSTAEESSILTFAADGVIKGDGTIANPIDYAVTLKKAGATLKIEGGNFIANCTAINVVLGTVEISGGFFEDVSGYNGQYLINCYDANYSNETAKVVITGGTFVNWNPAAANSENPAANFVPAGYEVKTETQANDDVWYTVVEAPVVTP